MRNHILAALSLCIILISIQSTARIIPESRNKAPQIKGAKFKVGECASWPLGDKTNISRINSSMIVAGNTFYVLDGLGNAIAGMDAQKFDALATKIPCPQTSQPK